MAGDLVAAGLRRVNISLDTLRRDRFVELTRRDELDHVLDGIDAAVEAGLRPVKVNAVVMRGVNDDEIVDLAAFGRDRGVTVRFIEWMPLDADERWRSNAVVSQAEIVAAIGAVFPIDPVARGHQPAERFVLPRRPRRGRRDPVGDAAVLRRLRPHPAHGRGRAALVPVRGRRGRPARPACAAVRPTTSSPRRSAAASPTSAAGHMIGQVQFVRPRRSMSQIGG